SFDGLFGHTYIGAHPTPLRARFCVLRLDFSGLAVDSYDAFNASFEANMVGALKRFRAGDSVGFEIDSSGVDSFERLWSAMKATALRDKAAPSVRRTHTSCLLSSVWH